MTYNIEEIDITHKLYELSLELPNGLTFLPENLETANSVDHFVFTASVVDVQKLFKQNGVDIPALNRDTELYRIRKNADIYLPAILFTYSLISQNPTIVSISLNVLSNYIYDVLKSSFGVKTANIELYVETKKKGRFKKITYKGGAEGFKELAEIIKALK
jgi:hypothetical protein